MAVALDHRPLAPVSLHAVAKLIRLLSRVKDRHKPAKDRAAIKPLARRVTSEEIEPQMQQTIQWYAPSSQLSLSIITPSCAHHLNSIPRSQEDSMGPLSGVPSCGKPKPRHVQQYAPGDLFRHQNHATNFDRLLQELDTAAARKVPLHEAAADDRLFLQAATYRALNGRDNAGLRRIVDVCDALLDSISRVTAERANLGLDATCKTSRLGTTPAGLTDSSAKFFANLQYLLLWHRQCALDAIVTQYLRLAEGVLVHFYEQWQYQKRPFHDWFSEWPNGERPLSTTWPWNVKPSLIVLWGVCWMFYDHNKGNAGDAFDRQEQFGQDVWMRQSSTSSSVEVPAQLAYAPQPPTVQSGECILPLTTVDIDIGTSMK